jgi:hypothetical protein
VTEDLTGGGVGIPPFGVQPVTNSLATKISGSGAITQAGPSMIKMWISPVLVATKPSK